MIHCLVVDDDPVIRDAVRDYLQGFGMQVAVAGSGAEMRRRLAEHAFGVILLDVMLPDDNGLALCKWVRETSGTPVIMLTAQGDPGSRVLGLELGADDYLGKPFEPRELVARIQAVLRRVQPRGPSSAQPAPPRELRFDGWTFDRLLRQLVSPQQVVVALSSAEFRLLCAFVEHPGRVMSRDRLIELTRAAGAEVNDRSIDLGVSRLRQKLGESPRHTSLIRTVRGEGYLFDAQVGR